MKSFISEDDIEQSLLQRLVALKWNWIECDPAVEQQDEVTRTGRANSAECVLPEILRSSLKHINPGVAPEIIDSVVKDLRKDFSGTDIVDTNYKLYNQIRNGIKVNTRVNGKDDFVIVKLIDFEHPLENDFTAVNQMWIKGHFRYRRPDVVRSRRKLHIAALQDSHVVLRNQRNRPDKQCSLFLQFRHRHGLDVLRL